MLTFRTSVLARDEPGKSHPALSASAAEVLASSRDVLVGDNEVQVAAANILAPALQQLQTAMQAQGQELLTAMQAQGQQVQQLRTEVQAQGQQLHAIAQDVDAMRQSVGRVEWVQANAPIRARNMVNRELVPLHKERSGGDHPVGALPPADVPFSWD